MKFTIIAILLVSIAYSANIRNRVHYEYAFQNFLKENSKNYATSDEYVYRLQVFADNLDKIEKHNALGLTYTFSLNRFGDITEKEFQENYLSKPRSRKLDHKNPEVSKVDAVPESIDWSTKGAVTKVKDQGACGSCWSFGTTGALEGAYFIKNKELKSFSEQQLVDCSGPYKNEGCNGGITGWAYEYIKDHGLCTEEDYPYHARDEKCKDNQCKAAVHITDYVINEPNEVALVEAIVLGPVAVDLDATPMMFYSKGIIQGDCPIELTHSVLGVGYGEENGVKYYKMKNSWGGKWGEEGYFRIIRDSGKKEGQCGLVLNTVYPIL